MKLPKEFLDALERGMCAAPEANNWRSMMVGGWDLARGFDWCTAYPEHQGHWHHVESKEPPLKVGGSWVFFKEGRHPGTWGDRTAIDFLNMVGAGDVEITFTDLRECDVPVAAYLETFHMYRAYLQKS